MTPVLTRWKAQAERAVQRSALRPAPPWPAEMMTDEAAAERVALASEDFWTFDRLYFPPEAYTQGYAEPSGYHRHLVGEAQRPGVYVHLGARKHGKTVTAKKLFAWLLLTGRVEVSGTLSQKLQVSRAILSDVRMLIQDNPRVVYDWKPRFAVANSDQLQFTTEREGTFSRWRFVTAFSEGRSVRGYARLFARPSYLLSDDLETRKSPMGDEQVKRRAKVLQESAQSMSDDGTLVCLGNDFDERCLMHRLRIEYEQKLLEASWRVERHGAWSDVPRIVPNSDGGTYADGSISTIPAGPLWPERFPAADLAELRRLLKPADEDEWQGEFLQNPQPPSGNTFAREHYTEYTALPSDARGVLYVDPNLAVKGKGDTTGITALFYSPSTDTYFEARALCRSFSDSSELLDVVLAIKSHLGRNCVALGFDGNVTQESTWTNLIRAWCRERQLAYPRVVWCRYRVDDLAKNVAATWAEGRILFEPGFSQTDEGRRYLAQVFAFRGKRAPSEQNDDAPDSLICAFELLHERGIARRADASIAASVTITPDFQF